MKTLDAGQSALLAASQLSVVTLCKLTTYSDRAALTVQATRYFSDGSRTYKWAAGALQQFEPWLLSMEPSRDTMNHLPSLSGGGIESALRRRRTITLRNWLPETGAYLFTALRAENIEHARIEIAQVFVDRGAGGSFNDLSALTGNEQTWLFRGEVASIGNVTEQQIDLELIAELPQIPWIYANVPTTNDPKDLGKAVPVALGAVKRVPAIGWNVGSATTLAIDATSTQTTLTLTDSSGFPSSGSAKIGTEDISWTGNAANVLTGVTRNVNGTRKQAQKAGNFVLEVQSSSTWVLSGIAASEITALYVLSPLTQMLTLVAATGYTKTIADAVTISGKTVASVTFTQAQLRSLLSSLYGAAEVSLAAGIAAQPVVSHPIGSGGGQVSDIPVPPTDIRIRDNNSGTLLQPTSFGVTAYFNNVPGAVSQQFRLLITGIAGNEALTVICGSSNLGTLTGTPGGWYTFSDNGFHGNQISISASPFVGLYEVQRTVQTTTPAPVLSQNVAITALELAGFSIGFGVRFYADLSGPLATGGNYSVSNGTLLTKMPDLLRYVLADLCGLGHSAIDASFATLCGATYLDDNAHGVELATLGEAVFDVLAALSYESRANLLADERTAATSYRLLAALATYAWPAATVTLTKWQSIEEEGRDAYGIRTRTRYMYDWHPELGDGIEAFSAAVQTTVAAAETKFGRHDANAVGLRTVTAAATATEIAGYYSQELARVAGLWRIRGVAWTDGYALERGDVVQFTPPWHGSVRKGRVIETTLRTDGLADVRVVEVA